MIAKTDAKEDGWMMNVFEFRSRNNSRVDDEVEMLAERVIGAAITVHRHLGPGLPEIAYRNALAHELKLCGIAHEYEVPVPVHYKGVKVAEGRMDLLVARKLVVEIKVVEALAPVHRAQALGYLRACKLQLALLINFNVAMLKDGIKHVIDTV